MRQTIPSLSSLILYARIPCVPPLYIPVRLTGEAEVTSRGTVAAVVAGAIDGPGGDHTFDPGLLWKWESPEHGASLTPWTPPVICTCGGYDSAHAQTCPRYGRDRG